MLTFSGNRTVTVSGPALPPAPTGGSILQLASIEGSETLSEIYSYTLELLTPPDLPMLDVLAANLNLKDMIGKSVTVTIELDGMGSLPGASNIGQGVREISGIVTEATFGGQLNRQSRYQLVMMPWIYLANQRTDYRIFQDKTVVEIVDEVLGFYSYSWDKRLSASYPVLEYQVQYGETDFAFIQRLMQEHGIYWFFEHSGGFHRMVLVDQLGAHKPVDSIAYQTLWYYPPGHKIDMEHVSAFDPTESLQSGVWTSNDFDFKKPRAYLETQNALPRDTAHNQLERYEWPGDYTDRAIGEERTRIRMEHVNSLGSRAWGEGNVRDVVCGTTFTLEGYPQKSANREYLVIGSWIRATDTLGVTGTSEYSFVSSFSVQPATIVFRPPRTVPKPRTTGPQTAIVTGANGPGSIWTDKYGRVKLKFHWDRSPVRDHKSSCWIRVSYPWAGSGFGGVNIPRVGTEVIVDFENGDPDRPIVVGRVYNGTHMPPWDLPRNATQSGVLSRSMEGGSGNANAIRFEDRKGHEELWLQAEKDMRIEVENDELHTVGNNRVRSVGENEIVKVGNERQRAVKVNDTTLVGQNRVLEVLANLLCAAGDSITLSCGDSIIELKSNGQINLTCNNFNITAKQTGKINAQGGTLDLNMGSKEAGVEPHGGGEKTAIQSQVDATFTPK